MYMYMYVHDDYVYIHVHVHDDYVHVMYMSVKHCARFLTLTLCIQ